MGQEKSRREVVKEYLGGGVTVRELALRYGVKRSTLHRWINVYKRGDELAGVVSKGAEAMKAKAMKAEAMKAMPKEVGRKAAGAA